MLFVFGLIINSTIAQNIVINPDTTSFSTPPETTTYTTDSIITDTTASIVFKKHSPGKAALFSAILPGGGQVYNKKYWKLPIVYGGLAGLGTWIGFTAKDLNGYKDALRLHYDDDVNTSGSYKGISDQNQLEIRRQEKRKNLDLAIVITSLFYAANIIDAAVDAHLYEYDVTEDISVSIDPSIQTFQAYHSPQPVGGISLKLNFK
ncbi:MAG: DUF5683 domain-containing protein [Chitinophagales bacterium]